MFGLNDNGLDDSDYLLEEDEPRSAWRGVLALLLFALIGLLVYKQWDVVKASTRNLAEKTGVIKNEAPAQPAAADQTAATTGPNSTVSSSDITVNSDQTPAATPPPADTPLADEDPAKSAAPTPAAPGQRWQERTAERPPDAASRSCRSARSR